MALWAAPAGAVVLWSDLGPVLVKQNGPGKDILDGAVKRDDASLDTVYFKFRVNPISDTNSEQYFAAFELYEGDVERIGVGNALEAWAYSAFVNTAKNDAPPDNTGYIDLRGGRSAGADPQAAYQLPRRGVEVTFVFKVQYVVGGDDLVTVWLNPDLGPGATEAAQPEEAATKFSANASFDEIRLRHGGAGGGWTFSDMAVATSFGDFVDASSANPERPARFSDAARSISIRPLSRAEGAPGSRVHALVQSGDGYLWVGAEDGLARFDGVRFVDETVLNGASVAPVRALLCDSRGALWIAGADRGLVRRLNHSAVVYTQKNGLPSNVITAVAEDSERRVWAASDSGLARQDGDLWQADPTFRGAAITALLTDSSGAVWVAAKSLGLFQRDSGAFVPGPELPPDVPPQSVACLFFDRAGRLWVGAPGMALRRDGAAWRRYRTPRRLEKSIVTALAEEPDGAIRAGLGSGGLLALSEGEFASLPSAAGANSIDCLFVDANGKLWAGADSGLIELKRKNLFALGQGEGLGLGATQGLAETGPGVVWAAKSKDGIYRWDGRTFNRLTTAGLTSRGAQVNALLTARDGACWVATATGLLCYKDPRAVADEVLAADLPNLSVLSLAEGAEGEILAGTRGGDVWTLRRGTCQRLALPRWTNAVTSLALESNGALWIGCDGLGVFRVNNGSIYRIDVDSFKSDAAPTLYIDGAGTVWIGAIGEGLTRWRAGATAHFGAGQGLPDVSICQIIDDNAGHLWLGGRHGLACVSKRELDSVAAGTARVVHPRSFGVDDGMLSEECSGGFCPAALRDRSGLLWFPTAKGLVVIDPRVQLSEPLTPVVMVEDVLANGAPIPIAGGAATIPPGQHGIQFDFTGLKFDVPERVRFRYRLDGLDADWTSADTRRSIIYSYVPPGDYRFRVAASDGAGGWVENGGGLRVTALRRFWQTWWFIGGGAAALAAAVAGAVRVAEKRKLHRRLLLLEQQRALERERSRIAQDLHDEMGAKLCRISFLSEHVRRG